MKISEVYLEAAKLIDSGVFEYSCNAIDHILGSYPTFLSENYCVSMGFIDFTDFSGTDDEKRQHRVLLLLLASAIARDEEREKI